MAPRVYYYEYLKSALWQRRRQQTFQRAGGCCELCEENLYGKNVDIHHLTYVRLGREHPDDLMLCCPKCHRERIHGYMPTNQIIEQLFRNGRPVIVKSSNWSADCSYFENILEELDEMGLDVDFQPERSRFVIQVRSGL